MCLSTAKQVVSEGASSPHIRQGASDARLTIFDTSGVAVEDIVIAKMAFQAIRSAGAAQKPSRL